MADGTLMPVLRDIIEKSDSLADQIGLRLGVEDDLGKLRFTCLEIQAVILDAEEQQVYDHHVREWVGKLREVVSEANNLLDAFSTDMAHIKKMKKVCVFFSRFIQLAYGFKWGHKIKAIGEKLHGIAADRTNFRSVEQGESVILPAIKLSYNDLPSHLKRCLAYCSLFLEDYNINKQTLIRLWMAQGFIKLSHSNQCLEDVGHEYILNLLSRSFLQDVEDVEVGCVWLELPQAHVHLS